MKKVTKMSGTEIKEKTRCAIGNRIEGNFVFSVAVFLEWKEA